MYLLLSAIRALREGRLAKNTIRGTATKSPSNTKKGIMVKVQEMFRIESNLSPKRMKDVRSAMFSMK
jgi:hypothetical protein